MRGLQTPVQIPKGDSAFEGFQEGRQLRQQSDVRNAFQQYATDPQGARNALIKAGALKEADAVNSFSQQDQAEQRTTAFRAALQSDDFDGAAKAAAGDPNLMKVMDQVHERATKANDAIAGGLQAISSLPPEQRQAAWDAQIKPRLVQSGINPQTAAITDFSDQGIQTRVNAALGLAGQLKKYNDDRTYAATQDDRAQRQADRVADNERADRTQSERERADSAREGRLLAAVGRSGGGGGPLWVQKVGPDGMAYLENQRTGDRKSDPSAKGQQPDRKTEMDLRKEFDAQPETKNYRVIATAARQVQSLTSGPPTAQTDIALVYAYMRANDPNSVVREGEFATAQNAASIPDAMRNQLNKAINGQRLNPQQRANMVKTVQQIARASGDRFATIADNYRTYAQQAGANPDHIVKYERKTTGGPAKSAPAAAPKRLSPADAAKLEAGTRFIGEDGVERTKH